MPDEEHDAATGDRGTIVVEEARLQEDYTLVPNSILRRSDISPGAKLSYTMLLVYARQKGSCFPGQDTLSKDLGVSRRSVVTYLKELQQAQLLRVQRRGLGRTNVYVLTKWVQSRSAKFAHQEVKPRSAESAHQEVQILPREELPEEKYEEQQVGVVSELTEGARAAALQMDEPTVSSDLVGRLTERGITKRTAQQLAQSYEPEYLESKIDLVQWLLKNRPRVVGENPAGFLRKAIEQDYQPPPAYKTPEQRQAEAEQARLREEQRARDLEQEQEQERAQAEKEQVLREQARAVLLKEHPPEKIPGSELTTESAWGETLEQLREQMTAANFQTWLKDTQLVACDGSAATIIAPSGYVTEWLASRFRPLIEKQLEQVLGFRVQTKYLALSDLQRPSHGAGEPIGYSPSG
jgi:hypothetical protein